MMLLQLCWIFIQNPPGTTTKIGIDAVVYFSGGQ